jgi:hypothetical protein
MFVDDGDYSREDYRRCSIQGKCGWRCYKLALDLVG